MRFLICLFFSMPIWAAYHVEWVVFEAGQSNEIRSLKESGRLKSHVDKLLKEGNFKVLDYQKSRVEGDYFSMAQDYQLKSGERFNLDMKGPLRGDSWRLSVTGDVAGFAQRVVEQGFLFGSERYDEPYHETAHWKEKIEPNKVYLFDNEKVNVLLMVHEDNG